MSGEGVKGEGLGEIAYCPLPAAFLNHALANSVAAGRAGADLIPAAGRLARKLSATTIQP